MKDANGAPAKGSDGPTNVSETGQVAFPFLKKKTLLPLNARNAETAEAAIRELTVKVFEGLEVIAKQQATLSMLVERVGKLEVLLSVDKMQLTGLGPTVK